tara:strand:- start:12 stop:455 length:444 start_codon:yes stop_codon:yes gene_type:complete
MNSKTQQELKNQLIKELLVMNERLYNFYVGNVKKNPKEDFTNTPEFRIACMTDFMRECFGCDMIISEIILMMHNSYSWGNKPSLIKKEIDALIHQAKVGSDDCASECAYKYIKTMVSIEYPYLLSEAQITENIDHITIRFKDLGLMV